MNGYKPSRTGLHRMTALQSRQTNLRVSSQSSNKTSHLAESFNWDHLNLPIVNQGSCGSCWAISASEALEAQLQKNGHTSSIKVSAQALVDCVPNPQHCGGTGGCDGATGELAYAFTRDHGVPLESDLPYSGITGACPISGIPKQAVLDEMWPVPKRVVVSGWNQLPSNKVEPLKTALVNEGPVVVAVDGNNWMDYSSGIFEAVTKTLTLVTQFF